MNIDGKLKEAEVYHAMGMLDESLAIYQALIATVDSTDPDRLKQISDRAETLRQEIRRIDEKPASNLTADEISLIKKTVSAQTDTDTGISGLLSSASAFQELGLLEDAAAQYEKILAFDPSQFDFSPADIIRQHLECLSAVRSPEEILPLAQKLIERHALSGPDSAQVLFTLGNVMEKRSGKTAALDMFRVAQEANPQDTDIRKKIDSTLSTMSKDSRYDYLLHEKVVTPEQLQKALDISKQSKISVEKALMDHFKVKKEAVGKSLSLYYRCPFRSFDAEVPVPVELIGRLKKAFLIHYAWVPLNWNPDGVEVLVDDPKDLRKTDHIKALMATDRIKFSVGIREDIVQFINHFFSPREDESFTTAIDSLETIIPDVAFEEEEETEEDIETIDESSSQVVKFVDQVLVTAFRKNVSDIHIEPSPVTKTTGIRFRMDGVCQDYVQVPNIMAPGIMSRLKIMANLDIAERRLPQDGKIKMKRKGVPPFELRVSTMPTAGGFEDAVLRILAKAGAMKLDDMGLNDRNLTILKRIIKQPYGLILVVGPTGSGKTTTLHSALGHINKPEIKIWTAEDPVEITQKGLRQVEAKPIIGLDFARIMRGFLRLDPDVIMIGEMRDKETASIGVEASLTGHLVFSTLHTNSAPETVTRLLDMGLNPLNFSDAFLGVLAQRLCRRLCKDCRESYHPAQEEFDEIVSDYDKEMFPATGITYGPDIAFNRGKGCEKCSGSGYKGRMGIHELMEGTKPMKNLIKTQASTDALFEQAFKDSMTTLKQDGITKTFHGLTDINEIRRVCID